MLEYFLKLLKEELHLGEIGPKNEHGEYLLPLHPETTVLLKNLDPGAAFFSRIAAFPIEKKEELVIHLMKANFLGQGTGGGVIGLDENEKFLTLSLAMPYEINYKAFRDSLEDFTNYLDYWRGEIKRHEQAAKEGLFA